MPGNEKTTAVPFFIKDLLNFCPTEKSEKSFPVLVILFYTIEDSCFHNNIDLKSRIIDYFPFLKNIS